LICHNILCLKSNKQAQNQNFLEEFSPALLLPPTASRRNADIRRPTPVGGAGVIVGRSLYEGTLTLKDALAAAR
jgi:hypothetical protein